jgi:hypothetical protein
LFSPISIFSEFVILFICSTTFNLLPSQDRNAKVGLVNMDLDLTFWISISTLGINGGSARYPARQKGEVKILRTTADCQSNEILGPGHVDFFNMSLDIYPKRYAYGSRFDVLD